MPSHIGFIHIGKTGGTALKDALRRSNEGGVGEKVRVFAHAWSLPRIVEETQVEKVLFFIREPVKRYVSGFNSRLRKGYPRHANEWTPREAEAFERFKTPNELGEALGSLKPGESRAARKAMRAIRHCRHAYEHYLTSVEMLEKEKDRILFIGAQESLESDFEKLKRLLGSDPELGLPTDDVQAHKNPADLSTFISDTARANIQDYYKIDYEIYGWCKAYREELMTKYDAQWAVQPQEAGQTV